MSLYILREKNSSYTWGQTLRKTVSIVFSYSFPQVFTLLSNPIRCHFRMMARAALTFVTRVRFPQPQARGALEGCDERQKSLRWTLHATLSSEFKSNYRGLSGLEKLKFTKYLFSLDSFFFFKSLNS